MIEFRPSKRAAMKRMLAEYAGMTLVLAALVGLFGALSDHFFTAATFSTVANRIPDLTVIAVGMTFVLVVAGIDLSVGSVLALGAAVLGVAMAQWGWPMPAAAGLCIVTALAAGAVNGLITTAWEIPSFIVTLGMLEIARGGAYMVADERTQYIGDAIAGIGAPLAGIGLSPAFFIAVAVVIAGQIVLTRTVFGRYMIAIGTNEQVVRLSGIDPRPIKAIVFMLCGALAGLGAVFQTSRLGAADPNAGIGLELSAIAAVVIGGTSLMGGRGSVINTFFGVLIIAVLEAGLNQLGVQEPAKRLITGAVIVVAVVADVYRQKLTRR